MSAIASFYLIHNEQIPVIRELAKLPCGPVKRKFLWFTFNTGKWYDPFWEFLSTNARELEQFEWSGYVIVGEVYLFLNSHAISMETFADEELSDCLSNARESFVLAFRRECAQRLVKTIDRLQPNEAMIRAFLDSDEMKLPDDDNEAQTPIEAVLDGFEILRRWLLQVDDEHIGLLRVG